MRIISVLSCRPGHELDSGAGATWTWPGLCYNPPSALGGRAPRFDPARLPIRRPIQLALSTKPNANEITQNG